MKSMLRYYVFENNIAMNDLLLPVGTLKNVKCSAFKCSPGYSSFGSVVLSLKSYTATGSFADQ